MTNQKEAFHYQPAMFHRQTARAGNKSTGFSPQYRIRDCLLSDLSGRLFGCDGRRHLPCLRDNRTRLIERAYWIFLRSISGDAKLNATHVFLFACYYISLRRMSCANTIVSGRARRYRISTTLIWKNKVNELIGNSRSVFKDKRVVCS